MSFTCYKLVDYIANEAQCIDSNIEFIKQEVEIRIESIKENLDTLHINFKAELDKLKTVTNRIKYVLTD